MMVEVFIQLLPTKLTSVREELRKEQPNETARRAAPFVRAGLRAEEQWRARTSGPPRQVMSSVVDSEDLKRLTADLDQTASIIGCWKRDGLPLGVEYVFNADGEITGTRGTPTYAADLVAMLDAMPDVVDELGNRTRPARLSQAHRYMGWADRIYNLAGIGTGEPVVTS